MSQIGTVVTTSESPAATSLLYDTANAFIVGFSDWGPVNKAVQLFAQPNVQPTVGPRSATNATSFDALDVFFREGGRNAYFGRVAGPSASAATLTLNDGGAVPSILLQAAYVGNYGDQLQVQVNNTGTAVIITISDTYGSTLFTSPALVSRTAIVAWFKTTGFINAVDYSNGTSIPSSISTTALSGGTDDRAHATLLSWASALGAFHSTLGPGQVLAPGQTETNNAGIWLTLGSHALNNNRVAICDTDDGVSSTFLINQVGTSFQQNGDGPIGFWAGNLAAPGVVPGTIRSIPPSPVIAALCARVDKHGNPNQAAAGQFYPLQYCLGSYTLVTGATETYSESDKFNLNSAGINVFATRFGVFENFGFVSSIPPTVDVIYWQFNHCRLRMALVAETQIIAEPFVFAQLDGAGSTIMAFASALGAMLQQYYAAGALFGNTAAAAYSVNTGPTVNTPQSLLAGQLNAELNVRMSPFAQLVTININAVPITSDVPAGSTSNTAGTAF